MIDIKCFNADKDGYSVAIFGGIHGNEKCGAAAINKVISQLENGEIKLKSGTIYFVPVCNPKAYSENKRFCDVNLNRVIKDNSNPIMYEEFLAQELIDIMNKCDFMVDLHSNHTSGIPFAFQDGDDDNTKELIDCLPVKSVMCGWSNIYGETEDVSTSEYMYKINKFSVTIECGEHNDKASEDVAYNSIIRVLQKYNIIEVVQNFSKVDKQYMMLKKFITKPSDSAFVKDWQHGDAVNIGDVIGSDIEGNIYKSDINGFICLPFSDAEVGCEWFYLAEEL